MEPRLRLSLLSLKSLCTKFHLNWQLLNIYLLLYNKKHIRKFRTAFIRSYDTLKLKIAGLDSGSLFKHRLRLRLTSIVQAQGSGSCFDNFYICTCFKRHLQFFLYLKYFKSKKCAKMCINLVLNFSFVN